MVQSSIEVGHGPAARVTSEMVDKPVSSNRLLSGAPAFPLMRRVLGRKRLMREASDSDSDTENLVQGHPGHVIKKFSRRVSAPKSGDHSSKVQVPEEVKVETLVYQDRASGISPDVSHLLVCEA